MAKRCDMCRWFEMYVDDRELNIFYGYCHKGQFWVHSDDNYAQLCEDFAPKTEKKKKKKRRGRGLSPFLFPFPPQDF
jgi:predicted DNA-binding WGR domain protein